MAQPRAQKRSVGAAQKLTKKAPTKIPREALKVGRPRVIDLSRPITVKLAAQALRVAPETVRNLVRRGDLQPVPGSTPMRFTREEILRVAAVAGVEVSTLPSDGELAAAAFAAFRDGKSVLDVVIEHKIPPDQAEQLLQRYAAMGGDMVLPGEVARRIQEIGFFQGRPVDPYELPEILQGLVNYCAELDPDAREARQELTRMKGGGETE